MKQLCLTVMLFALQLAFAKEYKSLKAFQAETNQEALQASDWLKSDRIKNTKVWKKANFFNLKQENYNAYTTVIQRLYFYKWIQVELDKNSHEIEWVHMAIFISDKLRLIGQFPFKYFLHKNTITYTNLGSAVVFEHAFPELKELLFSSEPLRGEPARTWDVNMLHKEQYIWVESVYQHMDEKSLKQISNIAKGNGVYGLFVEDALEFSGDLKDPDARYAYAINILLPYCRDNK
ncbi:hypothetical protein [Formosa haliotis]|uniref:hypothetical protein n=1 Tax=Formosa haliotis TaxID=1555194 RepID=UPI000824AF0B|nr:hypothetical protein [Formosa haliotis]